MIHAAIEGKYHGFACYLSWRKASPAQCPRLRRHTVSYACVLAALRWAAARSHRGARAYRGMRRSGNGKCETATSHRLSGSLLSPRHPTSHPPHHPAVHRYRQRYHHRQAKPWLLPPRHHHATTAAKKAKIPGYRGAKKSKKSGIPRDTLGYFGILWDTFADTAGYRGIPDTFVKTGIPGYFGILWDTLGYFGILWDTSCFSQEKKK